ncbi:putative transcriptional regulatory protein [Penicillium chrysogenum]|uniref:Putative transcriptional regulatory protein n=1 Tax=Penicillium chrysogenum TaxID=5076 RepID=A0A167VYQ3_PENCH|nr:putative transcriptional regulatory protein [Penicillium chrysogenum]
MQESEALEQHIQSRKCSPQKQKQSRQINGSIHRRSTNACRYCKRRKIKCHYNIENMNGKCVACSKSGAECHFDVPPDGVLRRDAYVATLESRIKNLERQLQASRFQQPTSTTGLCLTPETTIPEPRTHGSDASTSMSQDRRGVLQNDELSANGSVSQYNVLPDMAQDQSLKSQEQVPGSLFGTRNDTQVSDPDVTILEMVYGRTFVPETEIESLPMLPSSNGAKKLVDAAYFYTQARYCIVDWNQISVWHQQRDTITYVSSQDSIESQTGAFFIWIIYAIGARLIPDPENSTEAFFARARTYLPAIMSLQDMATVQALLCLVQYYFRAQTESPIWHLVGLVLRLCVKLRYHRKLVASPEAQSLDPYTVELRKRFFWCAYCFDRSLAIWSKLPFGISDSDIDAEIPIDIDDTCIDQHRIRQMQLQGTGAQGKEEGMITTMTAALHHLHVYRIRSKILTRFTGPHAQVPSLAEVQSLLHELDQWKQQAPQKRDSRPFPQQTPDRVQATYTQAVLLLIRPILMANVIDPDLIGLCVEFAVEACQNAKSLSLNPQTPPDRITVYHCFYCGVTLLQCLAITPTALTARRTHQAIGACLSALAVYTRVLPATAPFLRLFEDLSNILLYDDNGADIHPSPEVRNALNRIVSSDPSEASGILHSLSSQKGQEATSRSTPETLEMGTMATQYDSILGGQSSVILDTDFLLEMPLDISPLYAPDIEVPELWTEPWLRLSSTEYSQ